MKLGQVCSSPTTSSSRQLEAQLQQAKLTTCHPPFPRSQILLTLVEAEAEVKEAEAEAKEAEAKAKEEEATTAAPAPQAEVQDAREFCSIFCRCWGCSADVGHLSNPLK